MKKIVIVIVIRNIRRNHNMLEPLVSCVCCTYGRSTLLGEAAKCFIDQTYDNKELIIVNDQEGVILKMDSERDNIRIENVPERFGSLGEKRNYAMSLAQGDYICIWDDDDLFTPWRIKDSVDIAQNKSQYDIIKGQMALMSINNGNYKIVSNLFHSQAIITRKYVDDNLYSVKSVGEDVDYERNARVGSFALDPFYFYVYRWGLNIHHLSGIADEKASWERSLTFDAYQGMAGEIEIKPEFTEDHWGNVIKMFEEKKPEYAQKWKVKLSLK